jgi:hypothetical protein
MVTKTPRQLKLTDEATRRRAIERLKSHLNFQVVGYECTTETVLDVLIRAAVTGQTIETVCNSLADVVEGETIRGYLNDQIRVSRLDHLEQQSNQMLVTGLPRRLWKTPLEIAIDLHDEPFYGHSPELLALTCGGEAHKGTTRFFRVATAYVIFKDMRLTLTLLFVRPEDDLAEIVAALLRRLRILGFKVRRLYLDKGLFYSNHPLYRPKRLVGCVGLPHSRQKGRHPGAVSGSSQLSDPTHLQKPSPRPLYCYGGRHSHLCHPQTTETKKAWSALVSFRPHQC